MKIFHNTRCTKSRCALDLLNSKGIKFEIVDYLNGDLTENLLLEIIKKTGKKPLELIRTKEPIFKEKYAGKKLSDAQCIKAILKYPVLLERPIIIDRKFASVVRSEEEIQNLEDFLSKK